MRAVGVAAFLVSGCLGASEIRSMVTKPYNATEAKDFLDCVSGSVESYKVKVEDDGTVLMKPSSPRSLDDNGRDKVLFDCMSEHAGMLRTAAESSLYSPEQTALLSDLSSVSAEILGSLGASGQAMVSTTKQRREIGTRSDGTYNFYPDLDKGCGSQDLVHAKIAICNVVSRAYQCFQCENDDSSKTMSCYVWPHHNCQKGDERGYSLPPKSITPKIDRSTFSYIGNYIK